MEKKLMAYTHYSIFQEIIISKYVNSFRCLRVKLFFNVTFAELCRIFAFELLQFYLHHPTGYLMNVDCS